jgi:hypothetical protein
MPLRWSFDIPPSHLHTGCYHGHLIGRPECPGSFLDQEIRWGESDRLPGRQGFPLIFRTNGETISIRILTGYEYPFRSQRDRFFSDQRIPECHGIINGYWLVARDLPYPQIEILSG